MAVNYPGPLVADITYVYSGITHHHQLNFTSSSFPSAGDDISTIGATPRSGSDINILTAVNAYLDLVKPFFNTGISFGGLTIWKYAALSNDRTFITSASLTKSGTNASATQVASQLIYTFRTVGGGVLKLNYMETATVPGASVSRGSFTGSADALADFVESTDNWILARDNTYPIIGLAYHPGQNEALFKKRYRNL